jgi:hypothetical protein
MSIAPLDRHESGMIGYSHRVCRMPSFFSSRRNWDSPNPSPAGECAPSLGGGAHSLARGGGGGRVPIPTKGNTLWYSVNIGTVCTLWIQWTGLGERKYRR